MIKAFCPAHITCFFSPCDSADIMRKGSKGAGIRLDLGTTAEVEEKNGGRSDISIDGAVSEARIARHVLDALSPDRSFSVSIENDLPIGQGFSTSASGAIATALCVCDIIGAERADAFRAAHAADIIGGGGLGDVSGLACEAHQPFRTEAGLDGRAVGTGVSFTGMTVAVLGPELDTRRVLGDPLVSRRIHELGERSVSDYAEHPGREALISVSNAFSSGIGLESMPVSDAIARLRTEGIGSAMCMLGNSIFIDAPPEDAADALGGGALLHRCNSTDVPAGIIRRA